MLIPCYPGGKWRALTLSYDDNQIHDRQMIDVLNRYGVRATFHLNSGMLDKPGFVASAEVADLYKGHEIACHGVYHHFPSHMDATAWAAEIWNDRLALEQLAGYPVCGLSYAYGDYNAAAVDALPHLGIAYSRTVAANMSFKLPDNFLLWHPTCHHKDALSMVEPFFNRPDFFQLNLFYIWGHSFEFERQGNWDLLEELCQKLGGRDDIWYATNMEIKRYVDAVRGAVRNAAGTMVQNLSHCTLYYATGREKDPGTTIIAVAPGQTVTI